MAQNFFLLVSKSRFMVCRVRGKNLMAQPSCS
jgi:hypothetical protein